MSYKMEFIDQLNDLADVINTKAGKSGSKTIADLKTAVEHIPEQKAEIALEVALDLSEGNQTIEPEHEDEVFGSVTISKPETLVPENIAKDIEIAGIVGTLESGGGGELPSESGWYYFDGESFNYLAYFRFYDMNGEYQGASPDGFYDVGSGSEEIPVHCTFQSLPSEDSPVTFSYNGYDYIITCTGSSEN